MTGSLNEHLWIVKHPALRSNLLPPFESPRQFSNSKSAHCRAESHPLPDAHGDRAVRPLHPFVKSASEGNVLHSQRSASFATETGSPRQPRKKAPLSLSSRHVLNAVDEQSLNAQTYKVEIHEPGSDEKIVRSPLKKLFGDKGILGKSANARDFSDSGSKVSPLAHWTSKVKTRVEDMTSHISDRLHQLEVPHKRPRHGPSKFPVSLSPYVQGDFYMQLELLLNIETNNFIMHEINIGRITLSSVKTVAEQWRNKGRPQVLGFRYDLLTQRELVGMNTETIHFSGINAFSKPRLLSVLAAWRVLAKEISVRTFCQPDSAVRKHLFDARKVLDVVNASNDSMLAFQEMRSRVVTEIYKEERLEAERRVWNGVERTWSPSRNQFGV